MAAAPGRAGGLLSMVGTPIGNLRDASPRVVDTLSSADVVLCEDTRVTGRLLSCLGVHVPLKRCDENVIAERIPAVLGMLEEGRRVAFVSDAGMPGVSDPGQRLVDAALDRGVDVEVVPGPSAVTCALVASGLPMDHFFFEGFLPRKAGDRDRRLALLARVPGAVVLYESPHRVQATLEAVAHAMPRRQVALVRELTKIHEECLRAPAPELARLVAERGEVRGECVIVVGGPSEEEQEEARRREALGRIAAQGGADGAREVPASDGAATAVPTLDEAIAAGLSAGESKTKLAKRLARAFGRPRPEVYDRIVELSSEANQ